MNAEKSPSTSAKHKKTPIVLLNRDLSLLRFNQRVLTLAENKQLPLLERLKYVCIVSSNLDEFFEVRMGEPLQLALAFKEETGKLPAEFVALCSMAHDIVDKQYAIHNEKLTTEFAAQDIQIVSHQDRTEVQRNYIARYFEQEVQPLLVPISLDPSHPFPEVANKSLNFIVKLSGTDAFGRHNNIAIVKVPRILPRVVPLPRHLSHGKQQFVMLSSIIRAHLSQLFPERTVVHFSQFRVTRNSDLSVDEAEVKNLRTALRQGLESRHYGRPTRLEVSHSCSDDLASFLLRQFGLTDSVLFRVKGPVNLVRLFQFIEQIKRPELLHTPYHASWPNQLDKEQSIFTQLKQRNILLHQPYHTFDVVIAMLSEAVHDPHTLAIKMTIYRTGQKSVLMDLLTEAVKRGKEVTVVVELKARFDEEANINWAEALEKIGAQVVYGVLGLKTHAKMLVITRREHNKLARYAHLSTGNYNPKTAALYTDFSYLTAEEKLCGELDLVFLHIASQTPLKRLQHLAVAPFTLHTKMLSLIQAAARAARAGKPAVIKAKMNSLTDEKIALALIAAAKAGVQIDLIVRGMCILPAAHPSISSNIRVVSLIGRFLEHSRVFYFAIDGDTHLYLSSADWMSRNLFRRIEIAWRVTDPEHIQQVLQESLDNAIADTANSWQLEADGSYKAVEPHANHLPLSAQQQLMLQYGKAELPKRSNTLRGVTKRISAHKK